MACVQGAQFFKSDIQTKSEAEIGSGNRKWKSEVEIGSENRKWKSEAEIGSGNRKRLIASNENEEQ